MNTWNMKPGFKAGSIMETLAVLFTSKRTLYREIDEGIRTANEVMQFFHHASDRADALEKQLAVSEEECRQAKAQNTDNEREIFTLRQRVALLEASQNGRSDFARN